MCDVPTFLYRDFSYKNKNLKTINSYDISLANMTKFLITLKKDIPH